MLTGVASSSLLGVADALWESVDVLIARQLHEIRAYHSYANVSDEDLYRSCRRNVLRVVECLRGSDQLPDDAGENERSSGMQRALQGVFVEEVVACYRSVMGVLRDAVIEESSRQSLPADVVLVAMRTLWEITDRYSIELVAARSQVDRDLALRRDRQRQTFLQRLLTGQLLPSEIILSGSAHGIMPDDLCWIFRAKGVDSDTPGLSRHLEAFAVGAPFAPLIGVIDGELAGLAHKRPTPRNERTLIAVAGPVQLSGIAHGFAQASRVLNAALRFGRTGVVDTSSLGLLIGVLNEPEVGEALYEQYVGRVIEKAPMSDVLLETVTVFLESQRGYQATADILCIHVNTLRHRLERYEHFTGARLADTESILEVWWALNYRKIRRCEAVE